MTSTMRIRPAAIILVNGAELSALAMDHLTDLRAELSLGAASRLQLRFVIYDNWEQTFKIGQAFEVKLDDGSTTVPRTVLKGDITGLAVEADVTSSVFVVTGYDRRHRLGNDVAAKTHLNTSYGAAIRSVAQAAGIAVEVHSSLDSPVFPYLVQSTTNLAFINDIARRTGMECVMEGEKLHVRPRTAGSTITLKLGTDLRSFQARYTATERPTTVTTTGWNPASKEAVVGVGDADLGQTLHNVPIVPQPRSRPFGERKARVWRESVGSVEESKAVAGGVARTMTANELTGYGEALGMPALTPGCMVEVSGVDDSWNGRYYVSTVEHVYGHETSFLTRFTVGGVESSGLVDLVGAPARGAGAGGMATGVTIGIVTNTKDTQRKHGHVKVKLPYLGDIESDWARVATPYAGNGRGVMFMPEVNDEVLVAFEHGDLRRPYVIGSVWNGVDAPPLDVADEDTAKKKVIATVSGHRLTFFDGDAPEKSSVTIVLKDGTTKLHLGRDKIEIISADKSIELKHTKGSILLKDNGDIQLDGMNIKIAAKQNLEIEGTSVTVKAKASLSASASAAIELKGNAMAKLESSGVTELKGSIVKIN